MAQHSLTEQTYALSALFQAAHCVNELAHTGRTSMEDVTTLVNSIFIEDAISTIAIYQQPSNLLTGLEVLVKQLDPSSRASDINIARIVITLLVLERKVARREGVLDQVYSGIERAKQQAQHFESNIHENVLANLASLYTDTISQIYPKVMVMGEQEFLMNTDIVNKIRSLLLAGVRAAVLFRQLGGRRWHLLFKRKQFIKAAEYLLKDHDFPHSV